MQTSFNRSIALCTLLMFNSAMAAPPSGGRAFDIDAPAIQHEPATQTIVSDQKLVVSAGVTDESGVANATIYYRLDSAANYQSVELDASESNQYRITLPDDLEVGTLEYYLQAEDNNGNVVTQGSTLDPILFQITAVTLGLDTAEAEGGSNTLWWLLGGAVLLGLAASGGGGSSAPAPTTGSISIVGTAPE